jgi:hypothetical protein
MSKTAKKMNSQVEGDLLYIDSKGTPRRVRIDHAVPEHEVARFVGTRDWYRAIVAVAGPYFSAIVPDSNLAPWPSDL